MITLDMYYHAAEPNRIDKSAYLLVSKSDLTPTNTAGASFSATHLDPVNVTNPTFIITTKNASNWNYIHVLEWNRWYYVDSFTVLSGGRVQLDCHEDVLMTFKDEILASPAWVSTGRVDYDNRHTIDHKYMHQEYPTESRALYSSVVFPNDLLMKDMTNKRCIVMRVISL